MLFLCRDSPSNTHANTLCQTYTGGLREGGGMREHEVHVIEVCRGLLYAGLRGIDKFPEYTPHKGIEELTPAGFHPVDL